MKELREIDRINLDIYNLLKESHKKASIKFHTHSNVVGVFMHELMIYFSNYIIIRESKVNYDECISFPFLNTKYVNSPFDLEINVIEEKINFKNRMFMSVVNCTSSLINFFSKSKLYINFNSSINISLRSIVLEMYKRKTPIFIFSKSKLYLYRKEEQLEFLKEELHSICELYNINNPDVFINNFIKYVSIFLSNKKKVYKNAFYATGTNGKITNRIDCANFNFMGAKVIECAHGEQAALTLNDPYMGYAEMSYCDYNVSYGSKKLDTETYNEPLFGHSPKIIYRSSDLIKKIYSKSNHIKNISINENTKCLYIPTLLSANLRYGPFRDMDDRDYIKFQNSIMSKNYNITYKAHPKNKQNHEFYYNQIERKNLKEVFSFYDVYILDYMSTAYSIVCATDKPIIYLNLGLMNMNTRALEDVKKRVFWVDINLDANFDDQINEAIEDFNNHKINYENAYTQNYSLAKHNKNELEIFCDLIDGKYSE